LSARPCRFELRLSSQEFGELAELAERSHLTIAAYVRHRLFGERPAPPRPRVRKKSAAAKQLPSSDYCPSTSDHTHRYRPVAQLMMGGGVLQTCNWCEWKEVVHD
jgi:hypothetical protein